MQVIIKDISFFKKVNKILGITKGKLSTIYLKTNLQGLSAQIIDEDETFIIDFNISDAEVISDGTFALPWLDFVDAMSIADSELSIVESSDNYEVCGFPFPKNIEYKFFTYLSKKSFSLYKKDFKKIDIVLKKIKKELKKSIFTESNYILINFKEVACDIRHINNFDLFKEEISFDSNIPNQEFIYLDKNKVKLLENLIFNKEKSELSFLEKNNYGIKFSVDDVDIISINPKLNLNMYYPNKLI